jgi:V/A-type H+-transporting ATPase subunit I
VSIVALKKCTLIGLVREKLEILEELQALGCVHIEPLRSLEDTRQRAYPTRYLKAVKFLASCPRKLRPIQEDPSFDAEALTERCLALEERMRTLQDRCDFLRGRIRALEPWGEFHLPPEEALSGLKLWFYVVPLRRLKALPKNGLVWQVVHQTPQLAYVVVVAEEEPALWPLPRVHTGRMPLSRLKAELSRLEVELEDCALERERLTRFLALFYRHLGELEDQALRRQAADAALEANELFALQGWVPVPSLGALESFARRRGLGLIVQEPLASETPPTLLANPRPFAAGEILVRFYQLPRYDDWDPSAVVFVSFVAFFAIMLADAGYALLLLAALWLLRHRLSSDLRILGGWAAGASLVWGTLVGGYFGHPLPSHWIPVRLLALGDLSGMLAFSIVVGLLHLSLANLMRAWQGIRHSRPWLAPLGWIAAAWGGFGFWQGKEAVWLGVIGGGLAAVLVGSSQRPVKRWMDLFWRGLEGLGELTKATRLLGDVLSYLRLFAIALAGSALASTCNALAVEARGVVGLGVLESLLVLLIGHGINGGLSLMGAVIHGLRLNCIEFFGWALAGEGRPFRAFAKHGEQAWKT